MAVMTGPPQTLGHVALFDGLGRFVLLFLVIYTEVLLLLGLLLAGSLASSIQTGGNMAHCLCDPLVTVAKEIWLLASVGRQAGVVLPLV